MREQVEQAAAAQSKKPKNWAGAHPGKQAWS